MREIIITASGNQDNKRGASGTKSISPVGIGRLNSSKMDTTSIWRKWWPEKDGIDKKDYTKSGSRA